MMLDYHPDQLKKAMRATCSKCGREEPKDPFAYAPLGWLTVGVTIEPHGYGQRWRVYCGTWCLTQDVSNLNLTQEERNG